MGKRGDKHAHKWWKGRTFTVDTFGSTATDAELELLVVGEFVKWHMDPAYQKLLREATSLLAAVRKKPAAVVCRKESEAAGELWNLVQDNLEKDETMPDVMALYDKDGSPDPFSGIELDDVLQMEG